MLTVPLHMRYTSALADLHRAGLRVWMSDDGVLRWQLGQLAGYCADDQRLVDVVASELAAADSQLFAVRVAVAPQAGATTDTPPDELGLPFEFDDSDEEPDDLSDVDLCGEYVAAAQNAAHAAVDALTQAQQVVVRSEALHAEVQQAALRFLDVRQQIMDQLSLDRAVSGRLSNRSEQYATDAANSLDLARLAAANAQQAAERAQQLLASASHLAGRADQAVERAARLSEGARLAADRAQDAAARASLGADMLVDAQQLARLLRRLVLACWLAVPVAALACWLAGHRRVS